jgi:hypothetical protein
MVHLWFCVGSFGSMVAAVPAASLTHYPDPLGPVVVRHRWCVCVCARARARCVCVCVCGGGGLLNAVRAGGAGGKCGREDAGLLLHHARCWLPVAASGGRHYRH